MLFVPRIHALPQLIGFSEIRGGPQGCKTQLNRKLVTEFSAESAVLCRSSTGNRDASDLGLVWTCLLRLRSGEPAGDPTRSALSLQTCTRVHLYAQRMTHGQTPMTWILLTYPLKIFTDPVVLLAGRKLNDSFTSEEIEYNEWFV